MVMHKQQGLTVRLFRQGFSQPGQSVLPQGAIQLSVDT